MDISAHNSDWDPRGSDCLTSSIGIARLEVALAPSIRSLQR
jgi:hypothetical protein